MEAECTILAAFRSVLLGTQPYHVQSPPSRRASIKAVFAPSDAEIPEAVSPAAPPPITTMSNSSPTRDARCEPMNSIDEFSCAGVYHEHWDGSLNCHDHRIQAGSAHRAIASSLRSHRRSAFGMPVR